MNSIAPTDTAIECCLNNTDASSRAYLQSQVGALTESSCLQRCGVCYLGPFLVVDGQLVSGHSHAEILAGLALSKEARR